MAPKSRLSTTSTRKWAKCFSGSQSRKEGGKSRSCFKLSERKHLAMAASYSQTILWKATFLILLANFCESISDRLLDMRGDVCYSSPQSPLQFCRLNCSSEKKGSLCLPPPL